MRALVVILLAGCNSGLPLPGDLAAHDLSSSSSDLSITADAGVCDLSRTRALPGNGPIMEGTFCDEVYFCVAHGGVAQALAGIAPDIKCSPAGGPNMAGCSGVQWFCEWDPGTIDGAELAELCRVLAYPTPPVQVTCRVYL